MILLSAVVGSNTKFRLCIVSLCAHPSRASQQTLFARSTHDKDITEFLLHEAFPSGKFYQHLFRSLIHTCLFARSPRTYRSIDIRKFFTQCAYFANFRMMQKRFFQSSGRRGAKSVLRRGSNAIHHGKGVFQHSAHPALRATAARQCFSRIFY